MEAFSRAFSDLPQGTFYGRAHGRRYIVSKTRQASGRSWKLVAEELGGGDYISLNLYRTRNGDLLRPCEMPATKVVAFVQDLILDQ